MVQAVRHLHEAKVDEISERLRREGHVVQRGADAGYRDFDLVAEKNGQKLAITVKDSAELRASTRDLMRLRDLAAEKGFKDFRVILVNPPQQKSIFVPGLEELLLKLTGDAPPEQLNRLSDRTVVKRIHGVDVDSIAMEAGGVHVIGSAVVAVGLEYGDPGAPDAMTLTAEFPLHFDLRLDRDLSLRERVALTADTASFTGP